MEEAQNLNLDAMREKIDQVLQQASRRIVGQKNMLQGLITGFLCGGHVLLEGVPGLAKTTAVQALADAMDASFKRIQFTPDLLPADVMGTEIYSPRDGEFYTRKGPVFAHIVLADEINRAPAKVQSALLEAMQEHQVTIGDQTYPLPHPFLVLATQNPVDQEGTYPLPEAQVDRFMLKIVVGYPSREEEISILKMHSSPRPKEASAVLHPEELLKMRQAISAIRMDEKLLDYIASLIRATRYPGEFGRDDLAPLIRFGASPRASIWMMKASLVNAFYMGRDFVIPADVRAVAMDILRHRILLSFEAEAEEKKAEDILEQILDSVKVP